MTVLTSVLSEVAACDWLVREVLPEFCDLAFMRAAGARFRAQPPYAAARDQEGAVLVWPDVRSHAVEFRNAVYQQRRDAVVRLGARGERVGVRCTQSAPDDVGAAVALAVRSLEPSDLGQVIAQGILESIVLHDVACALARYDGWAVDLDRTWERCRDTLVDRVTSPVCAGTGRHEAPEKVQ